MFLALQAGARHFRDTGLRGSTRLYDPGRQRIAGLLASRVGGVHPLHHFKAEETRRVPIYDTCDEVQRKIHACLRKDGVTYTALLRAIRKYRSSGNHPSSLKNQGKLRVNQPQLTAARGFEQKWQL
jgi:hypothetical protein